MLFTFPVSNAMMCFSFARLSRTLFFLRSLDSHPLQEPASTQDTLRVPTLHPNLSHRGTILRDLAPIRDRSTRLSYFFFASSPPSCLPPNTDPNAPLMSSRIAPDPITRLECSI